MSTDSTEEKPHPHELAAQALQQHVDQHKNLLARPITLRFEHIYGLLFGFQHEAERTVDFVTLPGALAIFLKEHDPEQHWITVTEDYEVWRTQAYKASYKMYQFKRKKAIQTAVVEGARQDVHTAVFKALRRNGMPVAQAERIAAFASEKEENYKVIEPMLNTHETNKTGH